MSQITFKQQREFRDNTLAAHRQGVERAIATMWQRFSEAITLDHLSDAANMSRYHFSRVFATTTGLSPARFLAAIRMQEAKRLLLQTERSVTDISLDVGYNSLGTFTHIFADCVGFPPFRFRQLALPLQSLPLTIVIGLLPFLNSTPSTAMLRGNVICEQPLSLTIVGLFPTAIPKSHPSECVALRSTSRFAFREEPRAGSHIFAAGMVRESTIGDALLVTPGRVLVGAQALPTGAASDREISIVLRENSVLDPPIVVAFPLLIAESLAGSQVSNYREAN